MGGMHRCWTGRMTWQGHDVTHAGAVGMVRRGVGQVLERRHLFGGLSVLDNLELGAFSCRRAMGKRARDDLLASVFELFPRLEERKRQTVSTLSGGEQQMTAVGRALMSKPRLLILDEPGFGLAPIVWDAIYTAITRLRNEGMTIVIAEEDPTRVLALPSATAYVLVAGQIVGSGRAEQLVGSDELASMYLGLNRRS
jgi:branched-chain amino acid transport system ATP-binding protein